ncbi:peptidyl-Lys metalloendopeptidase [Ganoderma leucocontextum]|nr:peptidyl-Lys metalloendopeptidase [Ganoderma leucocontextum]
MFSASLRAVLIALAATASAVSAAPGLSLKVTGPDTVEGVESLKVIATLTNTGDETLRLVNDPRGVLDALPANTFTITNNDGASPSFIGVQVKYSPTQAATSADPSALTVIAPGTSVSLTHDLSSAYNFTDTGYNTYTVEASNLFHVVNVNNEISELRANAESYVAKLTGGKLAVAAPGLTKRASFNGCSAEQQSALNTAAAGAQNYSRSALAYLRSNSASSARYTTWFGTYTDPHHSTVQDHFGKISSNDFASFSYDCTCTRENTYAYVYADKFGTVYLCGAFWRAPPTGTDSKAGTLVHEASHFTTNGGTKDYAYGQSAAKSLAQSDTDKAVFNADSHEYFAENTPAQA